MRKVEKPFSIAYCGHHIPNSILWSAQTGLSGLFKGERGTGVWKGRGRAGVWKGWRGWEWIWRKLTGLEIV